MSLIVIEGLDGSGKGTQTRLLYETLKKRGEKVKKISFPDYDSPSSSLVQMYLAGEFGSEAEDVNAYAAGAFYAVDRFASYKKYWCEDYERGVTILADRYVTSNMVYQLGKCPKSEWDAYLSWTEDFEYGKLTLPRPDKVIYLNMPIEVSQRLLLKRYEGNGEKKDIHEKDLVFLEECSRCAEYAAKRLGWDIIDCSENGEPLPVLQIHEKVLDKVLN